MPKSPKKKTEKPKAAATADSYLVRYLDLGEHEYDARGMGALLAGDLTRLARFAAVCPSFGRLLKLEALAVTLQELALEVNGVTSAIGHAIEGGYPLRFESESLNDEQAETLHGWLDFAEAIRAGGVDPQDLPAPPDDPRASAPCPAGGKSRQAGGRVMAAQLVDLAAARARFAPKHADREARRATADAAARAQWLADLRTWPRRFRDLIEPQLRDPGIDLAEITAARRGELRPRWLGADTPAEEIAGRLSNYREHIANVRQARSRSWRTQRRRGLRHQADKLVEALWLYGIRKVDVALLALREEA